MNRKKTSTTGTRRKYTFALSALAVFLCSIVLSGMFLVARADNESEPEATQQADQTTTSGSEAEPTAGTEAEKQKIPSNTPESASTGTPDASTEGQTPSVTSDSTEQKNEDKDNKEENKTAETSGAVEAPVVLQNYTDLFVTDGGTITRFAPLPGITPTDIVVPEQIKGVTITAIADGAFEGAQLTSVQLPDTITSIGKGAFMGNSLNNGIKLPAQLKIIEENAFKNCTGISSLDFPAGLETIGAKAFENCTGLSAITFPDSLKIIDDWAFNYCTSLTTLVLPEGLQKIGQGGLASCNNLTSVNWPNSVGDNVGNYCFSGCSFTTFTIPEGVTKIPASCFDGCIELTEIKLPSTIKSIGGSAFGCHPSSRIPAMTIIIPPGIQTIDQGAFYGRSNITFDATAFLPNTIAGSPWGAIGKYIVLWKDNNDTCFWFDEQTQLITGLKPAGHSGCTHADWHEINKGNFVIPAKINGKNVLGFTPYAFSQNTAIKSLSFESGSQIKTIPEGTFKDCRNLSSVILPEGITKIGNSAFNNCKMENLQLPNTLETIGQYAFMNVGRTPNTISPLVLPDGLKTIGQESFKFSGFKEIVIGENIADIQMEAFARCPNLEKVTINGTGALQITQSSFYFSNKLTEVHLPGHNQNSINNAPWAAFYAKIFWGDATDDAKIITTSDGWVYNTITKTIFEYIGSHGDDVDLFVPRTLQHNGDVYTVEHIWANYPYVLKSKVFRKVTIEEGFTVVPSMFFGCNVKDVVLPSTIKTIDDAAFRYASVGSINMPEGIESIESSAFQNCSLPASFALPSSLKYIGYGAFENAGLTSIELPDNLEFIDRVAFKDNNLTKVTIPNKIKTLSINVFQNNPNLKYITVDQNRGESKLPPTTPWGAPNDAFVSYRGDMIEITQNSTASDNRARVLNIDFTVPSGIRNITGVWVSINDGNKIQLYNSQDPKVTIAYKAMENATYTFYARTPAMAPGDYATHSVTVSDIGKLDVTAQTLALPADKMGSYTAAEILSKIAPRAKDIDAGTEGRVGTASFDFSISPADLAKINAMGNNDSVRITVSSTFTSQFSLRGDTYEATYDGASPPVKALDASGMYNYTNHGSAEIVVHSNRCAVAFDLNGGKNVSGNSDEYALRYVIRGQKTAAPAAPQKDGYTHVGWAVRGQSNAWNFGTNTVDSDITLVAQWEPVKFEVRYVAGIAGSTAHGMPQPAQHSYGQTVAVAEGPKADGYIFKGWKSDHDNNIYIKGDAGFAMPDRAVVLTAQWEGMKYTVTYDGCGADVDAIPRTQTCQYPDNKVGTLPTPPTKKGATFNGWYTEKDGKGTPFTGSTIIAKDTTVYAHWLRTSFRLTFDTNGGQGTPTAQLVKLGEKAAKPTVETRRHGYTLSGWNTQKNGSGANWLFESTTMPDYDVTLYAQWKPVPAPDPVTPSPSSSGPTPAPSSAPAPAPSPIAPRPAPSPETTPSASSQRIVPAISAVSSQSRSTSDPNPMERLDGQETPLVDASRNLFGPANSWSLLSLILSLISLAISILLIVFSIARSKVRNDEANRMYNTGKPGMPVIITRILSIIAGLSPGVLFLCLDSLSAPMTFVNPRTLIVLICFITHLITVFIFNILQRNSAEEAYHDESGF